MSRSFFIPILPGLALSAAVAGAAYIAELVQIRLFGQRWIDGLVFAIVIGTLIHTACGMQARLIPGIDFAAKFVLEVAVVLLGASIGFAAIKDAGLGLLAVVAGVVICSLGVSYGLGRMVGLSDRLATLVACGNSICGNSAIVAAAPVIDADSDDVAASIAFTAALGILVVLLLPLLPPLSGMDERHYGILAGMTVYAVPQVFAATVPVGIVSTQIGALVKLMRVLMLGPVILALGMKNNRNSTDRLAVARLMPWFIIGFLGMVILNAVGLIPQSAIAPIHATSTALTIVSMAALGLSVNIRMVMSSGGRVLMAGGLSIIALAIISLAAIYGVLPIVTSA